MTTQQNLNQRRKRLFSLIRHEDRPEKPRARRITAEMPAETAAALQRAAITSLDPPLPLPEPKRPWKKRLLRRD